MKNNIVFNIIFHFVWEQRKLENLVDFYSGLTYHPENIRKKGIFVIRSSNIKDGQLVTGDDIFVAPEIVNSTYVKKEDIIVVVRNGSRKLIGKHTKLNFNLNNAVIGAFMTGIRSNNNNFINAIFDSDNFKREIHKNLGATINQITTGEFKKMNFYIPSLTSEQNYLGNLIKTMNTLITLQQRKATLLKQLKSTLLDRLISGKDTPLVRFKEFKSNWTVFKLKDIITKTIKGIAKAEMHGKESIYLDTHYLNGGNPTKVDSPTNVSSNDIIILWDGSQAGKVYYGFSGALGSTLKSFTPKYSSNYLFQYLKKYQNKIFVNYRTPNIPHVIKDFTTVFKVNLPSTKEQIIISNLLKTLDAQITVKSDSVNYLKNIKHFLLQNMFI